MSKAQKTKEKILRQAAELFNKKGYAGSSMSDLMRATGLQKGGLYNHFKSKQELALEAFDFAFDCVNQRFLEVIKEKHNCFEQLQALVSIYLNFIEDPPILGGCPILNTAIESDDAYPALRERVQQAMDTWRTFICQIIERGIAEGEINSKVEADVVATIIISSLEGSLMMSKLYGDAVHMQRANEHLSKYLESLLAVKSR
ncbi:MAG: TetR/AcrR family transcriptional regulator [Symploca sp. SIO3C6]|uniref:TetR/AcrR family transcriptional regulator n=1 Tax=Symploca sp. SIO1C4 TaxID=2607765 RepID=A0A6B3NJI4_9CYAN|nr:TetR/AcrR family transcriptional regulator [Symploca sp. SIO3C6]NER29368.1 TetR/AcrR family transcriptional regulator [Symploca sp. SIO1C4]NET03924.1 TetR/AcrR family transcriptional regulator [Symploca sp. SIO2B6]